MSDVNAPRPVTLARGAAIVGVVVLAVGVAHVLDPLAYELRVFEKTADRDDFGRALRVMGWLPLWFVVSVVFVFADGRVFRGGVRPAHLGDRFSRGSLLLLGAVLSGGLAELGKLLSRRERPPEKGWATLDGTDAWYVFDWPTTEWLSSSGIGLPSSHTAVAFGAAFMLARLHPRLGVLMIALACGTGWQRIAAGAHYLSDTVVAAVVAWAAVAAVWRLHWWLLRRRVRRAAGE